MISKKIFYSMICTFVIVASFSCAQKNEIQKLTITKSDGTTAFIKAEMARTDEQKSKGFMERKNIPDGSGMLFLFNTDQILSFWMKNTPSPLSIAYITSSGIIRDIFDMEPFSLASITSTTSVRYALEVPQGWFEKENIKVGDKLTLDFSTSAE